MVERLTAEVHRIEAIDGMSAGLVRLGRAHCGCGVRRGTHGVPARRARRGASVGSGRGGAAGDPRISQPAVGPAMALRAQARTRCRRQRIAACRNRKVGQSLVASLVRFARYAPIVVLGVALAATGVVVSRFVPDSLLPSPERPFAGYGTSEVRIEGTAYPRHATGADDVRTAIAAAPRRIVSQSWSTDEYLYSIVPPERVVGVSDTAYRAQHQQRPRRGDAATGRSSRATRRACFERDPDLVFTPAEARSDVPGLLREAGLPVYRIYTMFPTLASIEDHIRLVGYLTGEDARAAVGAAALPGQRSHVPRRASLRARRRRASWDSAGSTATAPRRCFTTSFASSGPRTSPRRTASSATTVSPTSTSCSGTRTGSWQAPTGDVWTKFVRGCWRIRLSPRRQRPRGAGSSFSRIHVFLPLSPFTARARRGARRRALRAGDGGSA